MVISRTVARRRFPQQGLPRELAASVWVGLENIIIILVACDVFVGGDDADDVSSL